MKNKHKLPSNFNVLTFTTPCPSCGGQVEFASTGSVMAVCEYCQTTVIRSGNEVKAQGRQSQTIEDYSPIQVGSIGTFKENQFAVVGRVQYQYTDGVWNEWYIQFDNGNGGWLSEALGQYSITVDKGEVPDLHSYDELYINQVIRFEDISYTVTDKRVATAIAGEGELPFIMGKGFRTWVADARYKRAFISLAYHLSDDATSNIKSETETLSSIPHISKGFSVPFDDLNMELLKANLQNSTSLSGSELGIDGGDITNATGKFKQKENSISKIECPSCGSPVPYIEHVTNCLICPACHTEFEPTGDSSDIIKAHSLMQHFNSSLPLGAKARIKEIDISKVRQFNTNDSINDDLITKDHLDNDDGYIFHTNVENRKPNTDSLDSKFSVHSTTNSRVNGQSKSHTDHSRTSPSQLNSENDKYHDYVVIGIQKLHEVGSYIYWTEYLLYSFTNGFLWLSEEPTKGWMIARVLNEFPTKQGKDIHYNGQLWYDRSGTYQSRVVFAMGAFNWQVKVNDSMDLTDYINGPNVITAEQNLEEITYTIASPVSKQKMQKWFGNQLIETTKTENFSKYNPESYGLDEKIHNCSAFHLLFGLGMSYLALFLGSFNAFLVTLVIAIIGLIILIVMTNEEHNYHSVSDVVNTLVITDSFSTKASAWIMVVLAFLINITIFGVTIKNSGYYSNSGRSGYSSSASHK